MLVMNSGETTVSVIDGNSNKVGNAIQAGLSPFEAALDKNGNTHFYSTNFAESSLSVIDGKTGKLTDTFDTGSGFLPSGCFSKASTCTSFGDGSSGQAVNPDNRKIYVVNTGNYINAPTATGSIYVLEPTQMEPKEK